MEILVALALIVIVTATVGFADWSISRVRAKPPLAARVVFPSLMPQEQQWQRVTSVAERSIERAASMLASNSAASRQLEAAEYALHCLLDDLSGVMTANIQSPLMVRSPAATRWMSAPPTALAA